MTPDETIREVGSGKLRPVYVLVGEESVLVERVLEAVRRVALQGALADFNQETLTAGEADINRILNALRTAPMLAKRRFVVVRGIDRWDAAATGEKGRSSTETSASALERLAAYVAEPLGSTCLVLLASKLDKRRKLATIAKKLGCMVECDAVSRQQLPRYVQDEARMRGHGLSVEVAELLAEISGPQLGPVIDSVERLSLYVGAGAPIEEKDVVACITRVRTSTQWDLLDAVARRDAAAALRIVDDVYEPQDRGLPLVGLLAWSVRQMIRFAAALRQGDTPDEAARAAGAPPFKARQLAAQVRKIPEIELERWVGVLARTDLALKGSRRPSRSVLESAILTMTIRLPK